MLSGPMFESDCPLMRSVHHEIGGHYNIWAVNKGKEMETLKLYFPDGVANEMNFILFSTSGVHGSYTMIEDIEISLDKYKDLKLNEDCEKLPEDYVAPYLTGLIIQPRLVCMRYFGEMKVKLEDIPYLKKLRQSSFDAILKIGL